MKSVLLVNGSSDDRTEIYGAIREEFVAWPPGERKVTFDNGATVTLDYDDEGVWRVRDVETPGDFSSHCVMDPGEIPIFPDYTETAILELDADVSGVEVA